MNKTTRYILWTIIVVALTFVVWRFFSVKNADAHDHNVWSEWKYSEWSACSTELQCGVTEGQQTATRTRYCKSVDGHGDDVCKIEKSCPAGYVPGLSNKCWKCVEEGRYGCKDWDSKNYIYTPEKQEEVVYESCKIELPPCIEDQCANLEGVQETVPEGMEQEKTEEGLMCTPTPVPTPTPQNHDGPVGAPQCPNGVPATPPANAHVIRNGSSAVVNAHIPEGDRANIYYKENGADGWKHAVRDIVVTGKYLSHTINDLNPALGYTFAVQASSGCAGGELVSVVVDPPANGKTFMFSYFDWMD